MGSRPRLALSCFPRQIPDSKIVYPVFLENLVRFLATGATVCASSHEHGVQSVSRGDLGIWIRI
jgi:hypothetical protein